MLLKALLAKSLLGTLLTGILAAGIPGAGSPKVEKHKNDTGIMIFPAATTLETGGTILLTAMDGEDRPREVVWAVREGNEGGSVDLQGLYVAPGVPGTYHVDALAGGAANDILKRIPADPPDDRPPLANVSDGELNRVSGSNSLVVATATVTVVPPDNPGVDFEVEDTSYYYIRNSIQQGDNLYVRLRVFNRGLPGSSGAASSVLFRLDGREVGRMPFYLPDQKSYTDVIINITIPYMGLGKDESREMSLEAVADPDGRIFERNESNNTARTLFEVKGRTRGEAEAKPGEVTLSPSDMTAYTYRGESGTGKVLAAIPGQVLHLKTILRTSESGISEYRQSSGAERVRIIVDGITVLDSVFNVSTSLGRKEIHAEYVVPNTTTGPLEFTVETGSGAKTFMQVPVVPWIISVRPEDLNYNLNGLHPAPGDNVELRAAVSNDSGIPVDFDYSRVAVWFLVNGVKVGEDTVDLSRFIRSDASCMYRIPAETKPDSVLAYSVVVDPYRQLPDTNHQDNTATVPIFLAGSPQVASAPASPSFSVFADALAYGPTPLAPGKTLQLRAAIRNNAATFPAGSLKVQFWMNDTLVSETSVGRQLLRPLQTYVVERDWMLPEDMSLETPPVFRVVLDPDGTLAAAGEDPLDNTATLDVDLGSPLLHLSAEDLYYGKPGMTPLSQALKPVSASVFPMEDTLLKAGQRAVLQAFVHNSGFVAADSVEVLFKLNGKKAAVARVRVPAGSTVPVSVEVDVPPREQLPLSASDTLTGVTGFVPGFGANIASVPYEVVLSPSGEDSGGSGDSGSKILAALGSVPVEVAADRGYVYVELKDTFGRVSQASVVLTAGNGGSQTASAVTDMQGRCTFFGVPMGAFTLTTDKNGYDDLTTTGAVTPEESRPFLQLTLNRNAEVIGVLDSDADLDMISDSDEALYRTDPNNRDTDGDGVIDGRDLSPTVNPEDPVWQEIQLPGMIRFEQVIKAVGLDGWVEVDHLISDDETFEDEGTKKSSMTAEYYKRALNRVFAPDNFVNYRMQDIAPMDVGIEDEELVHDWQPENSYTFARSVTAPNEYRFKYDYLRDYQIAFFKNAEPLRYPDSQSFFRYLLLPVKLRVGSEQSISVQFSDPAVYAAMYRSSSSDYRIPAVMYSVYKTTDFHNDGNEPFLQGTVVLREVDAGFFEFDIRFQAHMAFQEQVYVKLTPMWLTRGGADPDPVMQPSWNITGIVRSAKTGSDGNEATITEEVSGFGALNRPFPTTSDVTARKGTAAHTETDTWMGIINGDPAGTSRYAVSEITRHIEVLFDAALSRLITLSSDTVMNVRNVNSLLELAQDHWARAPKYAQALTRMQGLQETATLTAGMAEAWIATAASDTAKVVYFSAKYGVTATGALVTVAENICKRTGKLEMAKKLGSKKVSAGLAVATGLVEITYDVYKVGTTKDPIEQIYYEEKIASDAIDTGISVAAVFVPHVKVIKTVWTVEILLYQLIFGEDFASKVAASPGKAVVFLFKYFVSGGIPSQMAEDAYVDVRDELIAELERLNDSSAVSYLAIFIDPDL